MPDYSVPSLGVKKDNQITLSIPQTQAFVTNQGYAYNQAGQTYNQAGVTYGGVTNETQDVIPAFSDAVFTIYPQALTAMLIMPRMQVNQTDGFLTNQGYTYNQAGQTYNQAGVFYGGVTNATQDATTIPHIGGLYDIYTQKPTPPPPSGSNAGPGWFMYINL